MRLPTSPRLFAALLAVGALGGTVACTALLGDFEVGPGGGSDDDGGGADGSARDGDLPGDSAADGPELDGGPDALPGDGGPPVPTGTFLSALSFGSTNQSPPANMRVAYGPDGSLFILFAYSIPITVLGQQLTPVGNFDMGVIKLGPDGKPRWVKSFGSAAQEYPGGLAVDGTGDVYISGATEGQLMDFGGSAKPLIRKSNRYLGWILKLGGVLGVPQEAIGIDVAGSQGALCQALDARGPRIAAMCNVYGGVTFPMRPDGTPVTVLVPDPAGAPAGSPSIAIAALDSTLRAHWVNVLHSEGNDVGTGIRVAGNGDVLFTANANANGFGTVVTLIDTLGTVRVPLGPLSNAVVGRLSATAGAGLWMRGFPGDTASFAQLYGLDVDGAGRVITTGALTGTMPFGNPAVTSTGGTDVLVATFDGAAGQSLAAKVYGGPNYDEGRALAVDRWDTVALAGTYSSIPMRIDGKPLPDPFAKTTSGFVARAAGNLPAYWAHGFTTALDGTFVQAWSVATDPVSGRVAAAGTFKGLVNFGDGNPVRSDLNGGAYNVWVVQRAP